MDRYDRLGWNVNLADISAECRNCSGRAPSYSQFLHLGLEHCSLDAKQLGGTTFAGEAPACPCKSVQYVLSFHFLETPIAGLIGNRVQCNGGGGRAPQQFWGDEIDIIRKILRSPP